MATVVSTRAKISGAAVFGTLLLVGILCGVGGVLGWFTGGDNKSVNKVSFTFLHQFTE